MDPTITELIELRKTQALTLREIGIATDLPEKTIWRILSNNDKPQTATLTKIRKFVNDTKTLLAEADKRTTERYERSILDHIYDGDNGVFWARPKQGARWSEASYPEGVAIKNVWFHDILEKCDILGKDDLILKGFNNLCQSGKLKILSIAIPHQRPMKKGEGFLLRIEIGTAYRTQAGQDDVFDLVRRYDKLPLDQSEQIPDSVRDPRAIIIRIRNEREAGARAMHGHYDLSKETELHRENLEDQASQRQAQLQLIDIMKESLKGDKEMEGDHIPPSEYDAVTFREKKREFFEDKVSNDTPRPLIVYDCYHKKVEIPPGESRLVMKMRPLKK